MSSKALIQLNMVAFLVIVMAGFFGSPKSLAQDVFFDDFETGGLRHAENGFRWASPDSNKIAVVNSDGYITSGGLAGQGPFPERKFENAPGEPGTHALSFYFDAGSSSREKRFSLGGVYPEIWISYWVRVPINYVHGTIGPGPGFRNQKWFALWTDTYAGSSEPTIVFNIYDERNAWSDDGKSGESYSTVTISNATNMNSAHREKFPGFIRFPEDQGRWMHIVARYKIASSRGAEDGIVQWWRRWENEAEYTVLSDRSNLGIGTDTGPAGFTAGYIFGWANGAYESDTEFLMDEFRVSTRSLLDAQGAAPKSPEKIAVN